METLTKKEKAAIKEMLRENYRCAEQCKHVCDEVENGTCLCQDYLVCTALEKMLGGVRL